MLYWISTDTLLTYSLNNPGGGALCLTDSSKDQVISNQLAVVGLCGAVCLLARWLIGWSGKPPGGGLLWHQTLGISPSLWDSFIPLSLLDPPDDPFYSHYIDLQASGMLLPHSRCGRSQKDKIAHPAAGKATTRRESISICRADERGAELRVQSKSNAPTASYLPVA